MADLRQAMDVDSVSILFLSLLRKEHTNLFRFSMELAAPVDPEALQQAVDVIWRRLPSVVACIKPDFFHYRQVPAQKPPVVRPDPGILKTMDPGIGKDLRQFCGQFLQHDSFIVYC
jgi:hypothetical protein